MFSCLRMAAVCFNVTTHRHPLLISLRTILATTETARFGLTTHPWVCYHLSLSQVHCHLIAHACQSNGHSTKQTKFVCFCGPHNGICHTSVRRRMQLGTICHLCGFHKGRQGAHWNDPTNIGIHLGIKKETRADSETHIPNQIVLSTATRSDHWSLQQRAKLGMSGRKRPFSGTRHPCTVNGAP